MMQKKLSKVPLKTIDSCPVCGSGNVEKYWAMPGYRLSRCRKCSMVWDHSPAEDLLAQYDTTYYTNDNPKGGYANYYEGMKISKNTFRHRLRKIAKKYGKGSILDVGCAFGDCLVEAKKMGWSKAHGVEVSAFARSQARKKNLKVYKGPLRKAKLQGTYDVIIYQDVIEHIIDPVEELRNAKKYLKKNGILLLITPDIGGFWAKIMRSLWYHYKPGEHVTYFNKQSMRKALKIAGFKNIEIITTYHILSIEYVFNRLKYYSPFIFENFKKLSRKLGVNNYSFRAYTGEFEAWAQKN